MVKIPHIILLLVCCWHQLLVADEQPVSIQIDDLLVSAEANKVREPEKFKDNLTQLGNMKHEMNNQQREVLKFLQGYQLAYEGDNAKAMDVYDGLINNATYEVVKYRALVSAANISAVRRNYSDSLEYLDQAFNLSKKIQGQINEQHLWAVAAIVYNLFEDYELSLRFADLVLKDKRLPDNDLSKYYRCAASNIKIRIELKQEIITADDPSIAEIIHYCNENKLNLFSFFIILSQSEFYLKNDNTKKAMELLKAHYDGAQAIGYTNLSSLFDYYFAKAYARLNLQDKSVIHANLAVSKFSEGDFNHQIVQSYKILYEYYLAQNDHSAALDFYKKYSEADKATLDDHVTKNMAYQVAKHKDLETAQRIKLLSQDNELLQLQKDLAKKSAQNVKLLLSVIVLILVIMSTWIFKLIKRDKFLKKQASLDHLTNILNRKGLEEYMSGQLNKAEASRVVISFAIFDLDLFKKINDKYGHMVGDWVIKRVTETCSSLCKRNSSIGRLGGEEFAIAMINASAIELQNFCEQCRAAINQIDTSSTGNDFLITASFGVTSTAISGYDYKDLLNDADAAMYSAKRAGRNQVTLFSSALQVNN